MRHFFIVLLSIALFTTRDILCMLRSLVLMRRPNAITAYCKYDRSESEQLRNQIDELHKTIESQKNIMFEQHVLIRKLREEIARCASRTPQKSFAIPQENKGFIGTSCIQSTYIPEHNMHYSNKAHE